jgi:hypothetical protein
MTTSGGSPVQLALMRTCRKIGHETKGLAFELNTLHFYPTDSEETWKRAGQFQALIERLTQCDVVLLEAARRCKAPALPEDITREYPGMRTETSAGINGATYHYLPWLHHHSPMNEPGSTVRRFFANTVDLVSKHPEFAKTVEDQIIWRSGIARNPTADEILSLRTSSWYIPTVQHLELAQAVLDFPGSLHHWDHVKYRFSAAAVAIDMLRKLDKKSCMQIRHIYLHEDCTSVAYPDAIFKASYPSA